LSVLHQTDRSMKHTWKLRDKKKSVDECRKCKHVLEEIEGTKREKNKMDIGHLDNSANLLCEKPESTGALKCLAEANACKCKAKEKKNLLTELNDKINQTFESLKNN